MIRYAVAMRAGVSIAIVTVGTCLPSCQVRSPCGTPAPWNPQMPRSVVAPAAPALRSRRVMTRWSG